MADFPKELKATREQLKDVAQTARVGARAKIDVAARAEDGIRYIDWLEKEAWPVLGDEPGWYSTASGVAYQHQLESAKRLLAESNENVASAMSSVRAVVSGSSGLTTTSAQRIYSTSVKVGDVFKIALPDIDRTAAQADLDRLLNELTGSNELAGKRRAAWSTFDLATADSVSQAAHSMREILTSLLDTFAPDGAVRQATWWKADPQVPDGVSKRQKVQFFVAGRILPKDPEVLEELERQVDRALKSHKDLIKIAHHNTAASRDIVRTHLVALEDALVTLLDQRRRFQR